MVVATLKDLSNRPAVSQELVRMNAPKVHNEWRQKMRAAKLDELKAEVKVMMENHEHAIDCRDSMIQVRAHALQIQA